MKVVLLKSDLKTKVFAGLDGAAPSDEDVRRPFSGAFSGAFSEAFSGAFSGEFPGALSRVRCNSACSA